MKIPPGGNAGKIYSTIINVTNVFSRIDRIDTDVVYVIELLAYRSHIGSYSLYITVGTS